MSTPWKISLHGGHSGAYCDHAEGPLAGFVDAAIAQGCPSYGLTEHAPRVEARHLYDEELAQGWDCGTLDRMFTAYAQEVDRLKAQYAGRIILLKGFEAEVIPEGRYADVMLNLRARYAMDYMVGSVHWVEGHIIDYTRDRFERAVAACGGLEALAVRYYAAVRDMALALRPEVIGHLDLVRRNAPSDESVDTSAIRRAAAEALEAIASVHAILDVNTGAYRKGLKTPYPAPWLVEAAHARGIGFAFGDDSHRATEVAAGIPEARVYLLGLGVRSVATLTPGSAGLVRGEAALD
jgi:histidinol-phosphatase (PHP family)